MTLVYIREMDGAYVFPGDPLSPVVNFVARALITVLLADHSEVVMRSDEFGDLDGGNERCDPTSTI